MHEKRLNNINCQLYKFSSKFGCWTEILEIENFNWPYDWKCKLDQSYYNPDFHVIGIL